jgi:hypothetical protein
MNPDTVVKTAESTRVAARASQPLARRGISGVVSRRFAELPPPCGGVKGKSDTTPLAGVVQRLLHYSYAVTFGRVVQKPLNHRGKPGGGKLCSIAPFAGALKDSPTPPPRGGGSTAFALLLYGHIQKNSAEAVEPPGQARWRETLFNRPPSRGHKRTVQRPPLAGVVQRLLHYSCAATLGRVVQKPLNHWASPVAGVRRETRRAALRDDPRVTE